ncbi:mitochondrial assembly of ribosomal large subunit protein 1 isoform X2 [Achroia grisella]|uniref:mitochondrial assembly of ribosomal large subunit protein 1 isoform X2 n=1 Tax=Achroia grisella TaxID=688607 RepID=UPI0027D28CE4|nr:mitochondrial assembly of ribosomal large subunit protein 1 isoform X2 [Achroia grisella]
MTKTISHSTSHFFLWQICCGVCLRNPRQIPKPDDVTSPAIAGKYQVITEANAQVIENTSEEIHSADRYQTLSDEFDGINLDRGKTGVFDVEDLVNLLERENSKDIFVVSVPQEIRYVSYICIVTGRSKRHIQALAEFIRKVYKKKCNKYDPIPRIEGKNSDEWIALDLGNIALHIFSDKVRQIYDLETLWSVGPEYDEQIRKKTDDVVDAFENYSQYLKDLKPLD